MAERIGNINLLIRGLAWAGYSGGLEVIEFAFCCRGEKAVRCLRARCLDDCALCFPVTAFIVCLPQATSLMSQI